MPLQWPALDRLRRKLEAADGEWHLRAPISDEDRVKLRHLEQDGRPFIALDQGTMSAHLREEFGRAMRESVRSTDEGLRAVEERVAASAQAHVVQRFDTEGGDVALRALSPAYLRWKAAHGFDPRVGRRTGELVRRLAGGAWTLRK
jgi:hypothetical protein